MLQDKPQIAVFSLAYAPFEGGAEIATREIIKRLPGLDFRVFTSRFDESWLAQETKENCEILRVGKGLSGSGIGSNYGNIFSKIYYIFAAWQAAEKMHRLKKFKVIWSIMASYGGVAALFFKLRHPSIPLLLTIQEGDSKSHLLFGKIGMVGLWGGFIIKRADYIQSISSYLKDLVIKRGTKCPVEVIPNGVDIEKFSANFDEKDIGELKNNFGIKNEKIIITSSRLVYKNGIDILIKSLPAILKKMPVKCLIVGDGPERKQLEFMVKELNLSSCVVFVGQISQKELPLYLKASDLFVRASRSEGLGNSFLEAMAAGIPIIGTPVGGIIDFLVDSVTGFCIKPEDAGALADKILYVLNNKDLVEKVKINALALVRKNYSWEIVASAFNKIFEKLIK